MPSTHLAKLSSQMKLNCREIREVLLEIKRNLRRFDLDCTEVHLQVLDDGTWQIWDGDFQYVTDHRGRWASSTLTRRTNTAELARQLLEELE